MAKKQPSSRAPDISGAPPEPDSASRDGVQVQVSVAAYCFWVKPADRPADPGEGSTETMPCELWIYVRPETWPSRAANGLPVVPRVLRLVLPDGRTQAVLLPPPEHG